MRARNREQPATQMSRLTSSAATESLMRGDDLHLVADLKDP